MHVLLKYACILYLVKLIEKFFKILMVFCKNFDKNSIQFSNIRKKFDKNFQILLF